ncbi:hypothetical protein [Wolbachia pipientis]|uniref:hypothetical protein n=1 Tax=Wolbachia pipientis TaxID=955 RepID=UPI0016519B60|nr:hypothetical protein [Wolbachia pipientis]
MHLPYVFTTFLGFYLYKLKRASSSRYLLADEIPRMNRSMTVRGGMTVKQFVIPLLVSG